MAVPVVLVTAGARPVTAVESGGFPMTPVDTLGEPVTLVDAGGEPITLINENGSPAFLAYSAKAYLNGIAPYHWFDFINDRCLYASNDVGGVSGATGYSFSRASQGYYTNADGTLTSFASGALRRGNRGVLIEGARTNLLLRSQEFNNAAWDSGGTSGAGVAPTITADQGSAPDGTTTADRGQFSLGGGTASGDISLWRQSVTVVTATVYTFSIWLKSNTASSYVMQLQGVTSTVQNITVTPTWQRFVITDTTVSTGATPAVRLRGAQTPTNSNTADILMWGAQLEAGGFVSSYVPTTTASATRAADVLTCTAGVSYPLSLWAEFERAVDTGGIEVLLQPDNGSNNDSANLTVSALDRLRTFVTTGAAVQADLSPTPTFAVGAVGKGALRVATNDVNSCANGTLATADTGVTLPATPTLLRFGRTDLPPFGYIRRAAIFNSALSDANLQSVTG